MLFGVSIEEKECIYADKWQHSVAEDFWLKLCRLLNPHVFS